MAFWPLTPYNRHAGSQECYLNRHVDVASHTIPAGSRASNRQPV